MRFCNYLWFSALAMIVASCSSEEMAPPAENFSPKIVINASNKVVDETRVSYDLQTSGDLESVSAQWETTDQITVFANSDINMGTFSVEEINAENSHLAKLSGTLPMPLTAVTSVSAFVQNTNVRLVNSNKQIEVNFSNQDGTFEDAMSRSLLFANTQYNPDKPNELNMTFQYKVSFMKLLLDFDDLENEFVTLRMTGDNVLSSAWINTIYNGGGGTNQKTEGAITIESAEIKNGKVSVYLAIYPQEIKNAVIQAQTENGDLYEFEITKAGNTKKIQAGRLYQLSRTGKKTGNINEAATEFAGGDGTATSPYEIANLPHLRLLQEKVNAGDTEFNNKYYKMTADILINGEWKPIGTTACPFRGSFDGGNHSIVGFLNVSSLAVNEGAGVFGTISGAVVKNLQNKATMEVEVADKTKNGTYAGGIVGRALYKNTIEKCSNTGEIISETGFTGGIAGQLHVANTDVNKVVVSRMEACYNSADISSSNTSTASKGLGGLVGTVATQSAIVVDSVKIIGCYNRDNVLALSAGSTAYVAGLVGFVNHGGTAEKVEVYACWNSANTITGTGCAALVSSGGSVLYNVHDCWTRWINGAKKFGANTSLPYTNCKNGSAEKPYGTNITELNAAWNSITYKFDTNTGNIVLK